MLGPKRKYFQTPTDKNSSEQLRKLEKIKPFGHSKAPKKKKLGQILLIFPVLGKTTHICRIQKKDQFKCPVPWTHEELRC